MNTDISILTFKCALHHVMLHINHSVHNTMTDMKNMFILERELINKKMSVMLFRLQHVLYYKPSKMKIKNILNEFQRLDQLYSYLTIFERVKYNGCIQDDVSAFMLLKNMISDYIFYKNKLITYIQSPA